MGIFSKSKEKEKLVLVFDIESSSVGGALFWMQNSGIPKIILSTREPIVVLEEMDIDQFFSLTIKSLSVVAGRIARSGVGSPSKIFCVLSSLWYGSQTRIIRFKKDTSFIFNTKLADNLIQKEIVLFKEEHAEKYAHTGGRVLPIELKNMKTILNGYETPKPLGQKAQELEMIVFIAMSSEQFLEQVQEVMAVNFHRKNIKFSSLAMAFFTVVRDIYTQQEDFLLVDIEGEVTDISMTKKDILRGSISFPLGRNFIMRGLAKALHSTLDEAKALLSLSKDRHADEATQKKLGPIMEKLKNEWLKKFQESLANLSNDISIPATIYLTVDEDLEDFFSQTIKTEQFSQYTLTESKFEVFFLGAELFHGLALFQENVARDPNLIIDSIYINRFLR